MLNDVPESGKSVPVSEAAAEFCSRDDSCNLGLAGVSESAATGVKVELEEHEFDEFADRIFTGETKSSGLSVTLLEISEGGDFSDDRFTSGEEVDFGENNRVNRDLSDGLETGVVEEI